MMCSMCDVLLVMHVLKGSIIYHVMHIVRGRCVIFCSVQYACMYSGGVKILFLSVVMMM